MKKTFNVLGKIAVVEFDGIGRAYDEVVARVATIAGIDLKNASPFHSVKDWMLVDRYCDWRDGEQRIDGLFLIATNFDTGNCELIYRLDTGSIVQIPA